MHKFFAQAVLLAVLLAGPAVTRAGVELIGFGVGVFPPAVSSNLFASIGAPIQPGPGADSGASLL